jgi:hypothetical protein
MFMGKQDVINIIRDTKPELSARYGVERLGLFEVVWVCETA